MKKYIEEKIEFKPKFIEHYKKLTDWELFKKYSLTFLRRSIRVNTLKISIEELKKRMEKTWTLTQVPWCKEGFWIEHHQGRRDIGNTIEHSLGYIYVQEAASMIPPVVLDPKPDETILDMCASPGSKSTQIAQYMNNTGILVTNDYKGIRIAPLGINLQRMGITNNITTLMEGRFFKDFKFDKILVDAPCSGTGTIRKSLKTLRIWNLNVVKRLAGTQKQLIDTAYQNLKDGGTLVYSTCSCEPEENESVVDFLLTKYPKAKLEKIDLPIKKSPPILEFEGKKFNEEIEKCLRIWPQDNDTEGFFVAKVKKQ
ncbi:MAG: RsmB/NOP family class I SAM-dependent RNA methyltransferase [Candidatus Woesearchaeota archaeon]|jgi:NOL1/NOP2/sun family putative RNA methylase|nr:RsmB/NOP family class I SAM-dependent RNA methyltransferase [Candidatus Woesearchaeota archaeon]